MTIDDLYELPAQAFYTLDLSEISPQDLSELAYYIWCVHEDDEELLKWRANTLLPLVASFKLSIDAEVEEQLEDGE